MKSKEEAPTGDRRSEVWFITGASRGFGRAIATAALDKGYRVVATARNPLALKPLAERYGESVLLLRLDVTESASVFEAIDAAETHFGSVDVLVNNAGYGYLAAVEEGEDAEVRAQFETNFFGLAAVTRTALPRMRERRRGTIVFMSSGGGFFGLPGSGYYAASKFAIEGFAESLAREVSPLGLNVLIVEPGAFRTDWAGRSLRQSPIFIPDYEPTAGNRRRGIVAGHGRQPGDPDRAAQAIIAAVRAPSAPLRLVLGSDAMGNIERKLDQVAQDHAAWQSYTLSTDIIDDVPEENLPIGRR